MVSKTFLKIILYSFLLLLALFLTVNSVRGIILTPSSLNVETFTSQEKQVNLTIKNDYGTDLFNMRFSPIQDVTFPERFNLSIGEEKNVSIKFLTSTGYQRTLTSLVSFFTKGGFNFTQTTELVTINATGYNLKELTIIQGSTVSWRNDDTISHTVTSGLFDEELSPGGTFTHTFQNDGIIDYFDEFTNFVGKIVIQNKEGLELIHNPNTDTELSISINSILIETILKVELLEDNNFTIRTGSQEETVIRISNTGEKPAFDIILSGEWLIPSKTGFVLNGGESTFVPIVLKPFIQNSTETNQSYTKTLTISSNNTLSHALSFEIFIPFTLEGNITIGEDADSFFKSKLEFCSAFPTSPLCITEPLVKEVEKIIFKSPPLPYNYTQEDVDKLNRNYLELKRDMDGLSNIVKDTNLKVEENIGAITLNVRGIREQNDELYNQSRTNQIVLITMSSLSAIAFLLLIGLGIGGYLVIKGRGLFQQDRTIKT